MSATVLDKRDVLAGIAAPKPIRSEEQNERYTAALLEIERRPHLSSQESALAELLTVLIEAFEEQHYPIPDVPPAALLAELMAANNLRQKDLAEILEQPESAVSMLLNRKRDFSKHHIEKLSSHFNISPAAFFPKPTARSRK
jgi:HTH-type transcriptional regulator / antitoxin HigA